MSTTDFHFFVIGHHCSNNENDPKICYDIMQQMESCKCNLTFLWLQILTDFM